MKRRTPSISLLAASLLFSATAFSQTANEGKVEHTKGNKAAAVIELPYPEEEVADMLSDAMAARGVKGDKAKGFVVYRNVRLNDNDQDLNDLHFKVERKSRKEKDITNVYLIIGKPSENIGLRSAVDYHKIEEAKSFLNTMVPKMEAHHLEVQIKEQETLVIKAEKKFQSLVEDSVSYVEKIRGLEQKLNTNRTDRASQDVEVKKQRQTLEAMRSRRKPK
ncbi:hypothetical protein [Pseudobacter ginsenosidimutans]|uniref:DUF4349 domain-containing protein n=1 Tax=Pseudobacter ginsenosidimutans TaxID=661488 RepID=A0A4Q7MVU5_9BACT|nr:hypothetical protein [Pseudobacter ginsenosidimutans]QEC41930.1 hypothetical protein FSB84_09615 [Pseudobacter ginsenosidimutans]RZS71243.1 hypothetical protein EV199_3145 [Pseudobacter ginsenosidimutans]